MFFLIPWDSDSFTIITQNQSREIVPWKPAQAFHLLVYLLVFSVSFLNLDHP